MRESNTILVQLFWAPAESNSLHPPLQLKFRMCYNPLETVLLWGLEEFRQSVTSPEINLVNKRWYTESPQNARPWVLCQERGRDVWLCKFQLDEIQGRENIRSSLKL